MSLPSIAAGLWRFAVAQAAKAFLFPFVRTKEKETKRKSAGSRSEAKIFTLSLKKKNSLTLKQLFLLHGKEQKFLHASPLNAGRSLFGRLTHRFARWCGCIRSVLVVFFTYFVIQRSIATKDLVYIHLCESYVSPSWCSWDTSVSLDWICNPFIFLGSQTLIIEHSGLQIRCDKKNSLTNADVRQGVLCRWYLMSKFFTIFQSLRWIVL